MIRELDTVVLTRDVDGHGLKQGDVGVVVHVYPHKRSFEIEFVTAQGETIVVLTMVKRDFRPIDRREILHVRELESVAA